MGELKKRVITGICIAPVIAFLFYVLPPVWLLTLLLAIAVDPGWTTFVLTLALVLVIELISNNFIEPWLYGSSTSISAVAIILWSSTDTTR